MLNQIHLIGRLGDKPTLAANASAAIVNFSLATSEKWKDKTTGEMKERTEWHRIVLFGKSAEFAAQYLNKGDLVFVEGALRYNKWTDKNGVERITAEIHGSKINSLATSKPQQVKEEIPPANAYDNLPPAVDEDTPF